MSGTLTLYMAGEPLVTSDRELLYRPRKCAASDVISLPLLRMPSYAKNSPIRYDEEFLREKRQRDKTTRGSAGTITEELNALRDKELPVAQIAKELLTQYPDLTGFSISRGSEVTLKDLKESERILYWSSGWNR